MNKERAKYLLSITPLMSDIPKAYKDKFSNIVNPNGMTILEYHEVKTLWDSMSGNTSFADALREIALQAEGRN